MLLQEGNFWPGLISPVSSYGDGCLWSFSQGVWLHSCKPPLPDLTGKSSHCPPRQLGFAHLLLMNSVCSAHNRKFLPTMALCCLWTTKDHLVNEGSHTRCWAQRFTSLIFFSHGSDKIPDKRNLVKEGIVLYNWRVQSIMMGQLITLSGRQEA